MICLVCGIGFPEGGIGVDATIGLGRKLMVMIPVLYHKKLRQLRPFCIDIGGYSAFFERLHLEFL